MIIVVCSELCLWCLTMNLTLYISNIYLFLGSAPRLKISTQGSVLICSGQVWYHAEGKDQEWKKKKNGSSTLFASVPINTGPFQTQHKWDELKKSTILLSLQSSLQTKIAVSWIHKRMNSILLIEKFSYVVTTLLSFYSFWIPTPTGLQRELQPFLNNKEPRLLQN